MSGFLASTVQHKRFGLGRWVVYSLAFLLFSLPAILMLLGALKDANNYRNLKSYNATIGYKDFTNSCPGGSRLHQGGDYNYSVNYDESNKGTRIRCVFNDYAPGQKVVVYVLPSSSKAYFDKFSVFADDFNNAGVSILLSLIAVFFAYSLIFQIRNHKTLRK